MTYKDRNLLPYTEAVLLETLRLANIVPFSLPHVLDKEAIVDNMVGCLYPLIVSHISKYC